MSDIQKELRLKGRVELGDKIILYAGEWMLLKQGDTYIGQSGNDDPEILTMRRLEVQKRRMGGAEGKVFPKERKKPLFNLHEVVKITIMDNPNPPKEMKHDGELELPTPGPRGLQPGGGSEAAGKKPAPDRGSSRSNRPVPRAPRRGRVDYSAVVQKQPPTVGDAGAGEPERDNLR